MFRPYPIFIGLRYTAAKRSNHFISFISLTSMIGLTLGVAVLITVMSVMNGFDRELKERILGMVPHAVIKHYGNLEDWQSIDALATQRPDIIAAAPFIQAQGMVTHGSGVRGVLMNGILPDQEDEVSIISDHMVAGSIHDLKSGEFGIVIGSLLASHLRVDLGDKITIVLPEASITPAGVFPRLKRFTVKGIFKVGADLDSSLTLVHMNDAAKVLRLTNEVHGIRLKMIDLFKAPMIAHEIAKDLPSGYFSSDWTRTHGNLFQAIKMEKTMIGLLLMMIVAVAAFNIVSTLVMVVTDKKSDIAILRTMGASPSAIMTIFIMQGTFIGLIGNLLGTAAGILLSLNVSAIIKWVEAVAGHQFLNADVYFISYLPSQLLWNDVFIVCGAGFTMSVLATIYPAWRASKVDPAEALRYE
ncbi:lipoprotein-releasing ABC transporter permease subunit [Alkalimarinus alittae]|uniref:Lipoprotein-releasing ABC transporter permease subunit n=1 Tax=Alkalimarinus alittae TaxID=2961619 RepID=A0ABY6N747_9ALTE|nr:lipoprotein-releasing ABC transporter permease subunit [Alkalimarinus alittae]UZE97946.1 lipoprotein-releasing ABC transporter permease subunit [Alkalimarinus alittae]